MPIAFPDPVQSWPLYATVGGLLLLLMVAGRVPVLGRLVSIAALLVTGGLIVLALDQHGRLDPSFSWFTDRLKIDRQSVSGDELRVPIGRDGHFWARVRIGDVERRMLIDSGATLTAVSQDTADAAGLEPRTEVFPILVKTGNGTVQAKTAAIPELRLGNIVARDLEVVIMPGIGTPDVIGMNFLTRLKSWRVEGNTLILVPNNPQPAEKG